MKLENTAILVLNDINNRIGNYSGSRYRIINRNFDPGFDFSQVLFDFIVLYIEKIENLNILRSMKENSKSNTIPLICVLNSNLENMAIEALKMGADDVFIEPFDLEELKIKISLMSKRCRWFKKTLLTRLMPEFSHEKTDFKLTGREKDILKLVTQGLSNAEMAEKIFLSVLTVKTHLKNIFKKLNVTNRTEATFVTLIYNLTE